MRRLMKVSPFPPFPSPGASEATQKEVIAYLQCAHPNPKNPYNAVPCSHKTRASVSEAAFVGILSIWIYQGQPAARQRTSAAHLKVEGILKVELRLSVQCLKGLRKVTSRAQMTFQRLNSDPKKLWCSPCKVPSALYMTAYPSGS